LSGITDNADEAQSLVSLGFADRRFIPCLSMFAVVLWGTLARGAFYRTDLIVLVTMSVVSGLVTIGLFSQTRSVRRRWLFLCAPPVFAVVVSAVAGHDVADVGYALAPIAAMVGVAAVSVTMARAGGRLVLFRVVADVGTLLAVLCWSGVTFHVLAFAQPLNQGWRASATIGYANVTALFLLIAALTAGTLAARSGRLGDEVRCWLVLVGLLCTQSRSALVALVVCVGLGLLAKRRAANILARAGGAAVLAFAGLLPSIVDPTPSPVTATVAAAASLSGVLLRLSTRGRRTQLTTLVVLAGACVVAAVWLHGRLFDFGSNDGRLRLWQGAVTAIRQAGWFGIGPGQLASLSRGTATVLLVHNDLLQYALYYGLPGVLAIIVSCWGIGLALRRTRATAPAMSWDLAVAVLIVTGISALVDFPLQVPIVPVVVTLIVCAGLAPGTKAEQSPTGESAPAGVGQNEKEGVLCPGTE